MKLHSRFFKSVYIPFFFLCVLVGYSSCNSSNQLTNPDEDFDGFYDRFHKDEKFQMSRIIFPLEGSSEDNNGQRTWTPQNWHTMKVKIYDVDTNTYKVEYNKTANTFMQKFWLPNSGFSAEYRFEKRNGQWFLVYAYDTNL